MRIKLTRPARRELMREALWYDRQRLGLGDELLDEVARAIALLKEYPKAAPPIGSGFRRLLLARFPVGLIYRLDDDEIIGGGRGRKR